MQSLQESTGDIPSVAQVQVTCPVCGFPMYATDRGGFSVTFHCSNPEARFWDFDRGTVAQAKAKEHWDKSIREVFLNRESA